MVSFWPLRPLSGFDPNDKPPTSCCCRASVDLRREPIKSDFSYFAPVTTEFNFDIITWSALEANNIEFFKEYSI